MFLIAILILLVLSPYIIMLVRRILFAVRIFSVCRKNRYKLVTTSPLWFLSQKGGL